MNEIKKMIIMYLLDEYSELDATQQICFAEIEQTDNLIKVTYDNGIIEQLEIVGDKIVRAPITLLNKPK